MDLKPDSRNRTPAGGGDCIYRWVRIHSHRHCPARQMQNCDNNLVHWGSVLQHYSASVTKTLQSLTICRIHYNPTLD